jgi:hypothetical protein
MKKQIYNKGISSPPPATETSLCMKTWAEAWSALEKTCCHRQGILQLGNPLSAFALERHGQKIHVINCHNFSVVATGGGQEPQYKGGGVWEAKVNTSTSWMGTNVTGRVG